MERILKKAESLTKQKKFAQAFELLQEAEQEGNPVALYALGTWYLHGRHVKKDLRKGVDYLIRASNAGSKDALYDLAVCYEKGAGIEKNLQQAFMHYLMASGLGDKNSLYEVGRCFYYGIGVDKNRDLAKQFFDNWEGKTTSKTLSLPKKTEKAKKAEHA